MLHDPKWNHGTLSGLITWLEGRPRDGTYNFSDCEHCLIRKYMGEPRHEAWPDDMKAIYGGTDEHRIARGREGDLRTYGAALERAYAAQAALVAA